MEHTLVSRLWSKVDRRGPGDCWLWTAGISRSGRREVDYGCIREGRPSPRRWRAHRLALILQTAPHDVPRDDGEDFIEWLLRAKRFYLHVEAAHRCDVSLCCNPVHLEWLSHEDNVSQQRQRREAA